MQNPGEASTSGTAEPAAHEALWVESGLRPDAEVKRLRDVLVGQFYGLVSLPLIELSEETRSLSKTATEHLQEASTLLCLGYQDSNRRNDFAAAVKDAVQAMRAAARRLKERERELLHLPGQPHALVAGRIDRFRRSVAPRLEELAAQFEKDILQMWPTPSSWTRLRPKPEVDRLREILQRRLQELTHAPLTEFSKSAKPLSQTAANHLTEAATLLTIGYQQPHHKNDYPAAVEAALVGVHAAVERLRARKDDFFHPSKHKLDQLANDIDRFREAVAPQARELAAQFVLDITETVGPVSLMVDAAGGFFTAEPRNVP